MYGEEKRRRRVMKLNPERATALPSKLFPLVTSEPDDAARWRLRRNRILATSMLVGMGVIFTLTRFVPEPGFGTLLIQAGAEAGMVGGLADWFAVTAIFRHPMGIPIPHTAIIPQNKDR